MRFFQPPGALGPLRPPRAPWGPSSQLHSGSCPGSGPATSPPGGTDPPRELLLTFLEKQPPLFPAKTFSKYFQSSA